MHFVRMTGRGRCWRARADQMFFRCSRWALFVPSCVLWVEQGEQLVCLGYKVKVTVKDTDRVLASWLSWHFREMLSIYWCEEFVIQIPLIFKIEFLFLPLQTKQTVIFEKREQDNILFQCRHRSCVFLSLVLIRCLWGKKTEPVGLLAGLLLFY